MALDPYVVDRGVDGRVRWIVNPFTFFARALDLEPIPAPDFTTENGRRLLFVHIDGDSFASMAEIPGRYFSGQIIMREFLDRYPLPTTVSIVEGETSTAGVYPQLSKDLEPIAKQMFRLPNVEVASHSFSHPFDWVAAAKGQTRATGFEGPGPHAHRRVQVQRRPRGGRVGPVHQQPGARRTSRPRCSCGAGPPCPWWTPCASRTPTSWST